MEIEAIECKEVGLMVNLFFYLISTVGDWLENKRTWMGETIALILVERFVKKRLKKFLQSAVSYIIMFLLYIE